MKTNRQLRNRLGRSTTAAFAFAIALALFSATSAVAAGSPPAQPSALTSPAGAGQDALTVTVAAGPKAPSITACTGTSCTPGILMASAFQVPPPGDPSAYANVTITRVDIGANRSVIRLQIGSEAQLWQALIASPTDGTKDPVVLWSANTPSAPPDGRDSADAVDVLGTDVLVGQLRGDIELCGRHTLLAPRVLDPSDLKFKSAKLQRLSQADQDGAQTILAIKQPPSAQPVLSRLLSATGASSAIGSPQALTDGDPDTWWSEARSADGRGEFVRMQAPVEVALTGLDVVIRPPKAGVPHGVAPDTWWLVADQNVFRVKMPANAWKTPGEVFQVTLPAPIKTSCIAVALESAQLGRENHDAQVTFAEVSARSEFDGTTDFAGLAASLAGGGERARAAAAVLVRAGKDGVQAAASALDKLDEAGRRLALGVIDNSPCEASTSTFVSLLASNSEQEVRHARDRIRRCPKVAEPLLAGAIAGSKPPAIWRIAGELAVVAPEQAIGHLVPLLAGADEPARQALRTVLTESFDNARDREAISQALANSALPPPAALDVLRAAQGRFEAAPQSAGSLFARTSKALADTNSRYLLCEPASKLAALGDPVATGYLKERLARESEAMVATRAAQLASGIRTLDSALIGALGDPNVRVRQAAAMSLVGVAQAQDMLVKTLGGDPFSIGRGQAADTLGTLPPNAAVDQALLLALGDPSADVRMHVAGALGMRKVSKAAPALRARAEDVSEALPVRVHALLALGQMCDRESIDMLTKLASRAAYPFVRPDVAELAVASIASLGRLHPADLQVRLKPLLDTAGAARHVHNAANSALTETDICK